MEDVSFTVTLPSNSNLQMYPYNHGHNYIVKLAAPINLAKRTLNDDARWEVALTTIQYTNHFYQLREDVTINALVVVPDLKFIQMRSPAGKVRQLDRDVTLEHTAIAAMSKDGRRILKPFIKDETNKDEPWFVVLGKFTLPAGEYKSPMELAKRLCREFNELFNVPRYQYRMQVERATEDGRLRFYAESKLGAYTFMLYTKSLALSPAFGYTLVAIDDDLAPEIYYVSPLSTRMPKFNAPHTLYIYSDIVELQRVGDDAAQLLNVAPVEGTVGQRMHYVFDPPTYIPVSRNYMETINIVITDGSGGAVLFPDDVENVVCRLHFRRRV